MMQHYKLFLGIAVLVVAASWACVLIFGLHPGADVTGGVEWQITFSGEAAPREVLAVFEEGGAKAQVSSKGENIVIRTEAMSAAERAAHEAALRKRFGAFQTMSFSSIGPAIGRELQRRSWWALGGVVAAIALYVAWAFRKVSYRIPSWQYGAVAVIVLLHDVSVPLGVAAVLGRFGMFSFDTTVIVALLVVLGYSVNDTIVVFDRIREHLLDERRRTLPLRDIMSQSIRETLPRSINTSGTTLATVAALLNLGPASLSPFLLTVLAGVIAGTASSLFFAPQLLYLLQRRD